MVLNSRLLRQSTRGCSYRNLICNNLKPSFLYTPHTRAASTSSSPSEVATTTPVGEPVSNAFRVNAALVLTRPAQITRDPTPFEKAYFFYQRRLNERSALPFSRYFYFKSDTPAYLDFKRKVFKRLTAARDIGRYSGYGEEAWNDELLVGAQESEPMHQVNAIINDAESLEVSAQEIGQTVMKNQTTTTLAARETEDDKNGNEASLNRKLQDSVYLLVQQENGDWEFPTTTLDSWESLRQATERIIPQLGGDSIHTWLVGNGPIGHLKRQFTPVLNPRTGSHEVGEKTFFMKGRIMAGKVNLDGNNLGIQSLKWLTREEIQKTVSEQYWQAVDRFLIPRS